MNKIGSLYQLKERCCLVFSSKEAAVLGGAVAGWPLEALYHLDDLVRKLAAFYSKRFNCNVTVVSPKDLVVLLEVDGKYKKLLSSSGEMGWTWFGSEWNDCFEEVNFQ